MCVFYVYVKKSKRSFRDVAVNFGRQIQICGCFSKSGDADEPTHC